MVRRSDWPTLPPPFDPDRFARDSDAMVGLARSTSATKSTQPPPAVEQPGGHPKSEVRLVTRPKMAAVVPDEAWARTKKGALMLMASHDTLKRMPLDHRAGFLLSWMDGTIDLETLVEVSTMKREDVVRLVRDLFESGVVDFR